MTEERFLITGALGCIGVWTARNLVQSNIPTIIFDQYLNLHRLNLVLTQKEQEGIIFQQGDVTDLAQVEKCIQDNGVTQIIHLAALQLPFCKADPPKGAAVNVVGTVNIFEAAKRANIRHLVYASSTAVYGYSEDYPAGKLDHNAPLKPRSHYGVYKQANEGTAQVYWDEHGISSIGLRPYVVYGAGRDQGLTSTPTVAMLAAAASKPYHISYGGRFCFQYADDVAKIFIQSARAKFDSAEAFNIGGGSVHMSDVISAIEQVEPAMKGSITFDDVQLPFPEDVDNTPLANALGMLPETPLVDGVKETIQIFRAAIEDHRISFNN